MKQSYRNRFKITKNGKVVRRPMRVNHFLAKKRGKLTRMKRKMRGLDMKINFNA